MGKLPYPCSIALQIELRSRRQQINFYNITNLIHLGDLGIMSWTRSTRCCAFICIILMLQTIKISTAIAAQSHEQNQITFEPSPDEPAPTTTAGGGRR